VGVKSNIASSRKASQTKNIDAVKADIQPNLVDKGGAIQITPTFEKNISITPANSTDAAMLNSNAEQSNIDRANLSNTEKPMVYSAQLATTNTKMMQKVVLDLDTKVMKARQKRNSSEEVKLAQKSDHMQRILFAGTKNDARYLDPFTYPEMFIDPYELNGLVETNKVIDLNKVRGWIADNQDLIDVYEPVIQEIEQLPIQGAKNYLAENYATKEAQQQKIVVGKSESISNKTLSYEQVKEGVDFELIVFNPIEKRLEFIPKVSYKEGSDEVSLDPESILEWKNGAKGRVEQTLVDKAPKKIGQYFVRSDGEIFYINKINAVNSDEPGKLLKFDYDLVHILRPLSLNFKSVKYVPEEFRSVSDEDFSQFNSKKFDDTLAFQEELALVNGWYEQPIINEIIKYADSYGFDALKQRAEKVTKIANEYNNTATFKKLSSEIHSAIAFFTSDGTDPYKPNEYRDRRNITTKADLERFIEIGKKIPEWSKELNNAPADSEFAMRMNEVLNNDTVNLFNKWQNKIRTSLENMPTEQSKTDQEEEIQMLNSLKTPNWYNQDIEIETTLRPVKAKDWQAVENIFEILGEHTKWIGRPENISALEKAVDDWDSLDESMKYNVKEHIKIVVGENKEDESTVFAAAEWLRRFFRVYNHVFYLSPKSVETNGEKGLFMLGRVKKVTPIDWGTNKKAITYVEAMHSNIDGGVKPGANTKEVLVVENSKAITKGLDSDLVAVHESQHLFDTLSLPKGSYESWELEYTAYLKTMLEIAVYRQSPEYKSQSYESRTGKNWMVDDIFGGSDIKETYERLGENSEEHVKAMNAFRPEFYNRILDIQVEKYGSSRQESFSSANWRQKISAANPKDLEQVARVMLNDFYTKKMGYSPEYPDVLKLETIDAPAPLFSPEIKSLHEEIANFSVHTETDIKIAQNKTAAVSTEKTIDAAKLIQNSESSKAEQSKVDYDNRSIKDNANLGGAVEITGKKIKDQASLSQEDKNLKKLIAKELSGENKENQKSKLTRSARGKTNKTITYWNKQLEKLIPGVQIDTVSLNPAPITYRVNWYEDRNPYFAKRQGQELYKFDLKTGEVDVVGEDWVIKGHPDKIEEFKDEIRKSLEKDILYFDKKDKDISDFALATLGMKREDIGSLKSGKKEYISQIEFMRKMEEGKVVALDMRGLESEEILRLMTDLGEWSNVVASKYGLIDSGQALKEIFKNAVRHGSQMKFERPIYVYFDQNKKTFEVWDTANPQKVDPYDVPIDWAGKHKGLNTADEMGGEYKRKEGIGKFTKVSFTPEMNIDSAKLSSVTLTGGAVETNGITKDNANLSSTPVQAAYINNKFDLNNEVRKINANAQKNGNAGQPTTVPDIFEEYWGADAHNLAILDGGSGKGKFVESMVNADEAKHIFGRVTGIDPDLANGGDEISQESAGIITTIMTGKPVAEVIINRTSSGNNQIEITFEKPQNVSEMVQEWKEVGRVNSISDDQKKVTIAIGITPKNAASQESQAEGRTKKLVNLEEHLKQVTGATITDNRKGEFRKLTLKEASQNPNFKNSYDVLTFNAPYLGMLSEIKANIGNLLRKDSKGMVIVRLNQADTEENVYNNVIKMLNDAGLDKFRIYADEDLSGYPSTEYAKGTPIIVAWRGENKPANKLPSIVKKDFFTEQMIGTNIPVSKLQVSLFNAFNTIKINSEMINPVFPRLGVEQKLLLPAPADLTKDMLALPVRPLVITEKNAPMPTKMSLISVDSVNSDDRANLASNKSTIKKDFAMLALKADGDVMTNQAAKIRSKESNKTRITRDEKGKAVFIQSQRWPKTFSNSEEIGLGMMKYIQALVKKRNASDLPEEMIEILYWGAAEGRRLFELRGQLDKLGIKNVRLIGYSDEYHSGWEKAKDMEGIDFIWDTPEFIHKYIQNGRLDGIFSHLGLYYFLEQNAVETGYKTEINPYSIALSDARQFQENEKTANTPRNKEHLKQLTALLKPGAQLRTDIPTDKISIEEVKKIGGFSDSVKSVGELSLEDRKYYFEKPADLVKVKKASSINKGGNVSTAGDKAMLTFANPGVISQLKADQYKIVQFGKENYILALTADNKVMRREIFGGFEIPAGTEVKTVKVENGAEQLMIGNDYVLVENKQKKGKAESVKSIDINKNLAVLTINKINVNVENSTIDSIEFKLPNKNFIAELQNALTENKKLPKSLLPNTADGTTFTVKPEEFKILFNAFVNSYVKTEVNAQEWVSELENKAISTAKTIAKLEQGELVYKVISASADARVHGEDIGDGLELIKGTATAKEARELNIKNNKPKDLEFVRLGQNNDIFEKKPELKKYAAIMNQNLNEMDEIKKIYVGSKKSIKVAIPSEIASSSVKNSIFNEKIGGKLSLPGVLEAIRGYADMDVSVKAVKVFPEETKEILEAFVTNEGKERPEIILGISASLVKDGERVQDIIYEKIAAGDRSFVNIDSSYNKTFSVRPITHLNYQEILGAQIGKSWKNLSKNEREMLEYSTFDDWSELLEEDEARGISNAPITRSFIKVLASMKGIITDKEIFREKFDELNVLYNEAETADVLYSIRGLQQTFDAKKKDKFKTYWPVFVELGLNAKKDAPEIFKTLSLMEKKGLIIDKEHLRGIGSKLISQFKIMPQEKRAELVQFNVELVKSNLDNPDLAVKNLTGLYETLHTGSISKKLPKEVQEKVINFIQANYGTDLKYSLYLRKEAPDLEGSAFEKYYLNEINYFTKQIETEKIIPVIPQGMYVEKGANSIDLYKEGNPDDVLASIYLFDNKDKSGLNYDAIYVPRDHKEYGLILLVKAMMLKGNQPVYVTKDHSDAFTNDSDIMGKESENTVSINDYKWLAFGKAAGWFNVESIEGQVPVEVAGKIKGMSPALKVTLTDAYLKNINVQEVSQLSINIKNTNKPLMASAKLASGGAVKAINDLNFVNNNIETKQSVATTSNEEISEPKIVIESVGPRAGPTDELNIAPLDIPALPNNSNIAPINTPNITLPLISKNVSQNDLSGQTYKADNMMVLPREGISEGVVKNIIAKISQVKKLNTGRSNSILLPENEKFEINGKEISKIRVKGVNFDPSDLKAYDDSKDPNSLYTQAKNYVFVDNDGRFKSVPAYEVLDGGMTKESAELEARMTEKAGKAGIPVPEVLLVGQFTEGVQSFDGQELGFLVFADEDNSERAITQIKALNLASQIGTVSDDLIAKDYQTFGEMDYSIGKILRRLHDAGIVHKNPHFQNFGQSANGTMMMYDLETAAEPETEAEYVFGRTSDVLKKMEETLAQTYQGSNVNAVNNYIKSFMNDADLPIKRFMLGYFDTKELKSFDLQQFKSPVYTLALAGLIKEFFDFKLDGKSVAEVNEHFRTKDPTLEPLMTTIMDSAAQAWQVKINDISAETKNEIKPVSVKIASSTIDTAILGGAVTINNFENEVKKDSAALVNKETVKIEEAVKINSLENASTIINIPAVNPGINITPVTTLPLVSDNTIIEKTLPSFDLNELSNVATLISSGKAIKIKEPGDDTAPRDVYYIPEAKLFVHAFRGDINTNESIRIAVDLFGKYIAPTTKVNGVLIAEEVTPFIYQGPLDPRDVSEQPRNYFEQLRTQYRNKAEYTVHAKKAIDQYFNMYTNMLRMGIFNTDMTFKNIGIDRKGQIRMFDYGNFNLNPTDEHLTAMFRRGNKADNESFNLRLLLGANVGKEVADYYDRRAKIVFTKDYFNSVWEKDLSLQSAASPVQDLDLTVAQANGQDTKSIKASKNGQAGQVVINDISVSNGRTSAVSKIRKDAVFTKSQLARILKTHTPKHVREGDSLETYMIENNSGKKFFIHVPNAGKFDKESTDLVMDLMGPYFAPTTMVRVKVDDDLIKAFPKSQLAIENGFVQIFVSKEIVDPFEELNKKYKGKELQDKFKVVIDEFAEMTKYMLSNEIYITDGIIKNAGLDEQGHLNMFDFEGFTLQKPRGEELLTGDYVLVDSYYDVLYDMNLRSFKKFGADTETLKYYYEEMDKIFEKPLEYYAKNKSEDLDYRKTTAVSPVNHSDFTDDPIDSKKVVKKDSAILSFGETAIPFEQTMVKAVEQNRKFKDVLPELRETIDPVHVNPRTTRTDSSRNEDLHRGIIAAPIFEEWSKKAGLDFQSENLEKSVFVNIGPGYGAADAIALKWAGESINRKIDFVAVEKKIPLAYIPLYDSKNKADDSDLLKQIRKRVSYVIGDRIEPTEIFLIVTKNKLPGMVSEVAARYVYQGYERIQTIAVSEDLKYVRKGSVETEETVKNTRLFSEITKYVFARVSPENLLEAYEQGKTEVNGFKIKYDPLKKDLNDAGIGLVSYKEFPAFSKTVNIGGIEASFVIDHMTPAEQVDFMTNMEASLQEGGSLILKDGKMIFNADGKAIAPVARLDVFQKLSGKLNYKGSLISDLNTGKVVDYKLHQIYQKKIPTDSLSRYMPEGPKYLLQDRMNAIKAMDTEIGKTSVLGDANVHYLDEKRQELEQAAESTMVTDQQFNEMVQDFKALNGTKDSAMLGDWKNPSKKQIAKEEFKRVQTGVYMETYLGKNVAIHIPTNDIDKASWEIIMSHVGRYFVPTDYIEGEKGLAPLITNRTKQDAKKPVFISEIVTTLSALKAQYPDQRKFRTKAKKMINQYFAMLSDMVDMGVYNSDLTFGNVGWDHKEKIRIFDFDAFTMKKPTQNEFKAFLDIVVYDKTEESINTNELRHATGDEELVKYYNQKAETFIKVINLAQRWGTDKTKRTPVVSVRNIDSAMLSSSQMESIRNNKAVSIVKVDNNTSAKNLAREIKKEQPDRPVVVGLLEDGKLVYRHSETWEIVKAEDIKKQNSILIMNEGIRFKISDASKMEIREFLKIVGPEEFMPFLIASQEFDHPGQVDTKTQYPLVFNIAESMTPKVKYIKVLSAKEIIQWFGEPRQKIYEIVELNGKQILIVSEDIANDPVMLDVLRAEYEKKELINITGMGGFIRLIERLGNNNETISINEAIQIVTQARGQVNDSKEIERPIVDKSTEIYVPSSIPVIKKGGQMDIGNTFSDAPVKVTPTGLKEVKGLKEMGSFESENVSNIPLLPKDVRTTTKIIDEPTLSIQTETTSIALPSAIKPVEKIREISKVETIKIIEQPDVNQEPIVIKIGKRGSTVFVSSSMTKNTDERFTKRTAGDPSDSAYLAYYEGKIKMGDKAMLTEMAKRIFYRSQEWGKFGDKLRKKEIPTYKNWDPVLIIVEKLEAETTTLNAPTDDQDPALKKAPVDINKFDQNIMPAGVPVKTPPLPSLIYKGGLVESNPSQAPPKEEIVSADPRGPPVD
ncbi:MAG: hypothetical protein KBD53_10065, partial [Candidatus Omnitrophica bacterium]|nr:hypothetical protein [Candidatus Omnitrophota bacterium]